MGHVYHTDALSLHYNQWLCQKNQYRVIRDRFGVLRMEVCHTDGLGNEKWEPETAFVHNINFCENVFWKDAYKKVSIPLSVNQYGNALDGHMIDTRDSDMVPVGSQGIVHNYDARGGNHAPNDDYQDVYYKTEARVWLSQARYPS